MGETAEKVIMSGAVISSLGVSCRTGASIASVIPGFTPHTLAVKAGAAGAGCIVGMLSSVASAALFAKEATPQEIDLDLNDVNMSGIQHLPYDSNMRNNQIHQPF